MQITWKQAWKDAGWIFLLSRLVLIIVIYLTVSRIPSFLEPDKPRMLAFPHECGHDIIYCFNALTHWDAGNYLHIAAKGYRADIKYTAFFPLYPFLVRLASFIFGGLNSLNIIYAGLLVTNIAFFLSLVLLHRLVQYHFDLSITRAALFFAAFNPYAIFFFVPYPEVLFLLFTLAIFLLLHRGRAGDWWLAGFCGFFASLTRSASLVLAVPFLFYIIQRFWPLRHSLLSHWRSLLNAILPMALIPAGIVVYMVYLAIAVGDPLAFETQQVAVWTRHLDFPWVGLVGAILNLTPAIHFPDRGNIGGEFFMRNLIDIIAFVSTIVILIVGWKRIPFLYSLYALAMLLFSIVFPYKNFDPLFAFPRYMLVAFPLFLYFAVWSKHPRWQQCFSTLTVTMFVMNTVFFVIWRSVA